MPAAARKTSLADVLADLRAPMTPAALKWKLQTAPKQFRDGNWGKALVVPYIDARLVSARLNHVVGGDWSVEFEEPRGPAVVCRLTVLDAVRCDVGYADFGSDDPSMAWKTLYSDAFKRAAVHFGIGAFLYSCPKQYLDHTQLKRSQAGKFSLPPRAADMLSGGYHAWLSREDVKGQFGAPIDHGDMPEVEVEVEPQAPVEARRQTHFKNAGRVKEVRAAFAAAEGLDIPALQEMLDKLKSPPSDDVGARIDGLTDEEALVLLQQLKDAAQ